MKNTLVVFYSKNGSNKYLANKIAKDLQCSIEEIKPRLDIHLFQLMGIGLGNKKLQNKIDNFDKIILVGPIWMGKFIKPLKDFSLKYKDSIQELSFVTCCGSDYKMKDDKFGHGLVFKQVEELFAGKPIQCSAFPIGLVLNEKDREVPETVMKTRLNDDNFSGEIRDKYQSMIDYMKK